jgi:hypothetical protein
MEIGRSALQVQGEEQAHQPQVMVSVEVTDEDVIDFMIGQALCHQLHLSTLTAVDQEKAILEINELR